MQVRVALFTALFALVVNGATSVRAADKVWSGLVMANNIEKPHEVPPQLTAIQSTLVELFGYNQFDIIGESNKTLATGQEDWLATSKYFSLHVDARGVSDTGYELNLKLFQDKALLLETDTKLSKQSPLVVKGPQVGNGQLLLVLVVDGEASKEAEDDQKRHRRASRTPPNPVTNAWHHLRRVVRNAFH
jgi:hypothetical protein